MIMSLDPVAVQVGQSSEMMVESRYNMYGAYQVLVSGEGVKGEITTEMKPDKDGNEPSLPRIKIKFTAHENALTGVRDFRIATPQGVSTVGQIVVTSFPVVADQAKENNNTIDVAREISVPATVCGSIESNEDVDYFKFNIGAPGDWTFHVRAMRLQDKIHDLQSHVDPIITLRSPAGGTLAVSDNHFFADPLLSYHFDEAGEYLLEIRDVRYQGNKYWQYAVEINDQPLISLIHPLVVAKGGESDIELLGDSVPANTRAKIDLPADTSTGEKEVSISLGDRITNPVQVWVTEEPPILETLDAHQTLETAQPVIVPGYLAGVISKEGEIDLYRFEATKGQIFSFEVKARRLQSSIDSIIRILDTNGNPLQEGDDLSLFRMTYSDSLIENWTVPADGNYFLEIRDLHLRGGSTYAYAIQTEIAEPRFDLYVDTDKTQLTPGTAGVIFVRAIRKNGFDGDIQLHIDNLPEGVAATCGQFLNKNMADANIILVARPEAKQNVSNVVIRGTGKHSAAAEDSEPLEITAVPLQEIYRPGGGRGHWPMVMNTISINAPGDIRKVTLSQYDITLKPGEKIKIDIELERAESFDKNVSLDPLFQHLSAVYGNTLPPGVSVVSGESKTLLTGKETKGHIVLQADAKAAPSARQQVAVMANISLNFVMKSTFSSEPLFVTIAKPDEGS
ncbi:hypothetical protein [Polystyrenella longa]|nr:hypothetical protein [Polystyrenella longa]